MQPKSLVYKLTGFLLPNFLYFCLVIQIFYTQVISEHNFAAVYEAVLSRFPVVLQQHVRARANMAARQRSLLGYAMLCYYYERAQLKMPMQIHFGPQGKPHVTSVPQLHFSISHSYNYVVAAFGSAPLGIDVERIGNKTFEPIAKRFFAPSEYDYLLSLPKAHRRSAFYQLWTLKEAYIKALGRGMQIPLASFAFQSQPHWHLSKRWEGDAGADAWHVDTFECFPHYHVALCAKQQVVPIIKEWQLRDFIVV